MLDNFETLQQIHKNRIVAVIRGFSSENTYKTAEACVKGGVTNLELAFTSPHVDKTIQEISKKYANNSEVVVGAGTVLDPTSARIAIIAGAKFIVSPSFSEKVAKLCNLYEIPYIPGCFSPTEVQAALEMGANVVKIFPSSITGPGVINELTGPFPKLNIMPSGGVSIDNINEWLSKGAFAIGIGGSLVGPAKEENYAEVVKNAQMFCQKYNKFKHSN